jgi:tryptophanyl-tRNA synthetase
MSLQQPTQKMSKSHPNSRSRILITDTAEEMHKNVMNAVTDSQNYVSYDPANRPGVSNLLNLLSVFDREARTPVDLAESFKTFTLRDLKERVSESTIVGLAGIRERYLELLLADDGRYLDYIEAAGAKKASENAWETMQMVRGAVGI